MIFLQILKIIGIILLVLLGILLLALLLVLFYPVTYRIKGSYHKQVQIDGKVSWLFHLISLRCTIENQKQLQYLRILWFRKLLRDDFSENAEAENADAEHFESGNAETEHTKTVDSETEKGQARAQKNSQPYSEEDFFDEEDKIRLKMQEEQDTEEEFTDEVFEEDKEELVQRENPYDKNQEKDSQNSSLLRYGKSKKKFSIMDKAKDIWNRVKHFIKTLWQKICSICKTAEQFREFVNDAKHREAFGVLKTEAFHFLKVVCPSRMKLEASFSTGSPDKTGQALGILCLFPLAYQNRWRIYPDFESEEFYIEADFDVKGHVFLYQIIHIMFKIVLNKNCRQLYNDIRK